MSERFFLDTNIFVYAFDATAPAKSRRAMSLIRQALTKRCGVISFQVVQEFFNVALRRFSRPMSIAEAQQYLTTVFRPLLAVNSTPGLYFEALELSQKHGFSWYDSVIVAAAVEAKCDVLYSEDLQHGRELKNLRIENPFV